MNKKNSSSKFSSEQSRTVHSLRPQDLRPSFDEEHLLWDKGIEYIIGLDEVGRGAFAGPVVVAGCILTKASCTKELLDQINDSKLLKFMQRKRLAEQIKQQAIFYSIASENVPLINKKGIGKATETAFRRAISSIMNNVSSIMEPNTKYKIPNTKYFVLVDGFHIKFIKGIGLKNQKAIKKGDQKSLSIAAASIIAKDYRDSIMLKLSKKYPDYGWGRNKGYGTKEHQKAIIEKGQTKLHRIAFCATFLSKQNVIEKT